MTEYATVSAAFAQHGRFGTSVLTLDKPSDYTELIDKLEAERVPLMPGEFNVHPCVPPAKVLSTLAGYGFKVEQIDARPGLGPVAGIGPGHWAFRASRFVAGPKIPLGPPLVLF